jgi:TRAP-type transport system periplasmic protein
MRSSLSRLLLIICFIFSSTIICSLSSSSVDAKEKKTTEVKFAVLAPEGSTWIKLMREFAEDVNKKSKNTVNFRIFPGGISGDEFDVIRKMNFKKIDSSGFTGVGLGQILPAVRVLELPRLFDSYQELDYVVEKMTPYFEKEFDKKGYVFLGWAEVGFVNIFSNDKLDSLKSLDGVKMWTWEGDPLALELFKALKISPNPMPVTDVFTSLQTGLINAVYVSPLAAIAMQWFTKTKYMNTLKLTNATGAILMTKASFKKLSPENQKILKRESLSFSKKLISATRKDNEQAYKTLQKNNIKFVDLKDKDKEEFDKISQSVWKTLTGKLYKKELLDEVLKYRDEFRNIKNEKQKTEHKKNTKNKENKKEKK